MKTFLLLLSFLYFTLNSFAVIEPIVVKGSVKGIAGGSYLNQPINISIIEDFITNRRKVVKSGCLVPIKYKAKLENPKGRTYNNPKPKT